MNEEILKLLQQKQETVWSSYLVTPETKAKEHLPREKIPQTQV